MKIISADQFVDGLIAALCLEGKQVMDLDDPKLDEQFAKAYDDLLDKAEDLGVVPDFVIAADPYFGDSTCLRDAILTARDLKSVALNNPRFLRLDIKIQDKAAEQVLDDSSIPRGFLENLAKKYLVEIAR
jgi:hypothetical protein